MRLIAETGVTLAGARAVVVGRSNIVGKPMAQLLLAAHATVTIAHSRTRDLAAVCREADVLVAAVGRAKMVEGDWVKEGAVGDRRGHQPHAPTGKLVGDVDFDAATRSARRAITPVPGGVGPMTIACLLENTRDRGEGAGFRGASSLEVDALDEGGGDGLRPDARTPWPSAWSPARCR